LTTTTSAYPSLKAFAGSRRDFCAVFQKLRSSCAHPFKRAPLAEAYGRQLCAAVEAEAYLPKTCGRDWHKLVES